MASINTVCDISKADPTKAVIILIFPPFFLNGETFLDSQQKTMGHWTERSTQLQLDQMNRLEKVTSITFVPELTTELSQHFKPGS